MNISVCNHLLPNALDFLIRSGRWSPPTSALMAQLGPSDAVWCLTPEGMAKQLEVFRGLRDFGREDPNLLSVWDAYGFEASDRVGQPVELPRLDLDRALPIMLSDTSEVWLDYRAVAAEPRVVIPVRNRSSPRKIGRNFVVVSETADAFLRALYPEALPS
jgi:hypothetical protein